jgi:hypothetical protein
MKAKRFDALQFELDLSAPAPRTVADGELLMGEVVSIRGNLYRVCALRPKRVIFERMGQRDVASETQTKTISICPSYPVGMTERDVPF